jgi:hypothetical protein
MNQHLNAFRGKEIFMKLNLTQIIRSIRKSVALFDMPEKKIA